MDLTNFVIKYGYKEAIEEELNGEYPHGGRYLWVAMVSKYPNEFSGVYPSTDGARTAAFRTSEPAKQSQKLEWALANTLIFSPKLREISRDRYFYSFSTSPVEHYCRRCCSRCHLS